MELGKIFLRRFSVIEIGEHTTLYIICRSVQTRIGMFEKMPYRTSLVTTMYVVHTK
jgi:hypothetical protein